MTLDSDAAYEVAIAMAPSGDAVVVYPHSDASAFDVRARRYVAGQGWQPVAILDQGESAFPVWLDVAMDAAGRAVAVWQRQSDGFHNSIYAARYAGGWSAATLLEHDDGWHAFTPRVATNGAGEAVVAWSQSPGPDDSATYTIRAATFR